MIKKRQIRFRVGFRVVRGRNQSGGQNKGGECALFRQEGPVNFMVETIGQCPAKGVGKKDYKERRDMLKGTIE